MTSVFEFYSKYGLSFSNKYSGALSDFLVSALTKVSFTEPPFTSLFFSLKINIFEKAFA